MAKTIFALSKEAMVWGALYGLQQERIDFNLVHIVSEERKEIQTLVFRWHKNNPPKIEETRLTCMLTFNMVPTFVSIDYSAVVAIGVEDGVAIQFPIEVPPIKTEPVKPSAALLKLVN